MNAKIKQHIYKNWVWFGMFITCLLTGNFSFAISYFAIFTFSCVADQMEIDQEEKDNKKYRNEMERIREKWEVRGINVIDIWRIK